MSQLVRRAVEKEINSTELTGRSIADGLSEQLADVIEAVTGLDQEIEHLDDRLLSTEREVRDSPDVRDLANRVFEQLPTKEGIKEYEQLVTSTGSRPPEQVESSVRSGRLCDIAAKVDEPEHRVREALQKLQQDTHQVHTLERDDQTRYYKEG